MDTDTRAILIRDVPDERFPQENVPEEGAQENVPDFSDDAIKKRLAKAQEAADSSPGWILDTKIHRFPRRLRGIGGENDRYIVPSVVAIGPYHHASPDLRKMEEVKLAAAYYLCRASGRSTAEVYEKVRSVAGAARGCYDADDPEVKGLGDAEFAAMMFLDGCFLLQLQYMFASRADDDADGSKTAPVLQNWITMPTWPSIQKDIFLLENQIPWLVLEVLTEFMYLDMRLFVIVMGEMFLTWGWKKLNDSGCCCRRGMCCGCIPTTALARTTRPSDEESRGVAKTTHPHLLGLLRFSQVGCMSDQVVYRGFKSAWTSWPSSSAVELAEIGVVFTPSKEPWFGDMTFRRRQLFGGELSLSPVFLSDITACWLVNMAALEASTSTDSYIVSSYLSMLATLMDRDEDVHQLRAKYLLYSTFSNTANTQTLGFFKALAQRLRFGNRYYTVFKAIDSYKRHRSVRIKVYKFVYNNYAAIATFLSIIGVLVGIFKALFTLKQH